MKKATVAVIGVGAVGAQILRVLRQRKFPVDALRVFARRARRIKIDDTSYDVEAIAGENFDGVNIALFAGTEGEKGASSLYARKFVKKGAVVIDNGADFRLKDDVPLIVPEVNEGKIAKHKGIIANPNCTTIQAVVALGGIQKAFGLDKFVLTSFQAVSGAGHAAARGLWQEAQELVDKNRNEESGDINKKLSRPHAFAHQIAFNAIAQIGSFAVDNYTSEEWKVVNETRKIFGDDKIKITATCVRIPVFTGHSEAIYFTLKSPANLKDVEQALVHSEGVNYLPQGLPLPLDSEGEDEVIVGRLRRDPFDERSFWLWCVADNLRKGAALNAVQIAECLVK